jgi:hypothetical protein
MLKSTKPFAFSLTMRVAGHGGVASRLDQLFQSLPVQGLVLEQPDGSPKAEELLDRIPGQGQVFFYLRGLENIRAKKPASL